MQQQLNYKVGVYCRLSRDDGTNEVSMSIENQKNSLSEYVTNNNWEVYNTYIDDGYSGTNFERPAFKQLLEDVENGKINMVITKDQSRLGREFVQTSYYMYHYFPDNDVRYLAVNDDYDSLKENDLAPFKNIFNEIYAKDISKKIKFSMNNKMKQPKVIGSGIPLYGYSINENKDRVINPETAPIVKMIFEDYIKGLKSSQIAQKLFDNKVVNPSYYLYLKTNYNSRKNSQLINSDEKYRWKPDIIIRTIRCIEYTGDLINKKFESTNLRKKKRNKVKKDNQFHFENIFEPIISKEQYKQANKIMDSLKNSEYPIEVKKFAGKLICVGCGKELKFARKTTKYSSTDYYMCTHKNCKNKNHIRANFIEELYINEMTTLKNIIDINYNEIKEYAKTYFEPKEETNQNDEQLLKNLKDELYLIDNRITRLFEQNENNVIDDELYLKMMSKYQQQKELIKKQMLELYNKSLSKPIDINYLEEFERFYTRIMKIDFSTKLDRINIISLLDSIVINKKENIFDFNYDFKIKKLLGDFNNDNKENSIIH
ncbi:MAG: recombinase family protein [Mycoplasmatota bacterium]